MWLALLYSVPVVEMLAFGLVRGTGLSFAEIEVAYRCIHLAQMLALIIVFRGMHRNETGPVAIRNLVFVGLLLSLLGDVVNSFLIDLSFLLQPQTLLSVPPFSLAHICYISAFLILSQPLAKRGLMLTLLAWPFVSLGLWNIIIADGLPPLLNGLSLGYASLVSLMAMMSLWTLRSGHSAAYWAAAGGLCFLCSDMLFGAWLLEGRARPMWVSQAIWASYFLAQLLIARVPDIRRD